MLALEKRENDANWQPLTVHPLGLWVTQEIKCNFNSSKQNIQLNCVFDIHRTQPETEAENKRQKAETMLHYKPLDGYFITSQILSDVHVQTEPGYLQAGQSGYCPNLCTHKMNKKINYYM